VDKSVLSFGEQLVLALLRLLTLILGGVDRLFGMQLGTRMLDRLEDRWETRLAELDRSLATLEKEHQRLTSLADALSIHAASLYLGSRFLSRGDLRFDPEIPRDEQVLDAAIDVLVKERLAAIEPEDVGENHYVYHLEPDWHAIRTRLVTALDQARTEAEMAEWFGEGIAFIDESLLLEGVDRG